MSDMMAIISGIAAGWLTALLTSLLPHLPLWLELYTIATVSASVTINLMNRS